MRVFEAFFVLGLVGDAGEVVVGDAAGEVVGLDGPSKAQQREQPAVDFGTGEGALGDVGLDQGAGVVGASDVHHR